MDERARGEDRCTLLVGHKVTGDCHVPMGADTLFAISEPPSRVAARSAGGAGMTTHVSTIRSPGGRGGRVWRRAGLGRRLSTDRRTAEELRDTRGSRAVQVLLALAAPKKGYGAPGAGCPVINYGYSRRRPGLEAVCINFGQRYAAAAPYRPALAA